MRVRPWISAIDGVVPVGNTVFGIVHDASTAPVAPSNTRTTRSSVDTTSCWPSASTSAMAVPPSVLVPAAQSVPTASLQTCQSRRPSAAKASTQPKSEATATSSRPSPSRSPMAGEATTRPAVTTGHPGRSRPVDAVNASTLRPAGSGQLRPVPTTTSRRPSASRSTTAGDDHTVCPGVERGYPG